MMPNGEAGLDPDAWMAYWVASNNLSKLGQRDQTSVTNYYSAELNDSDPWKQAQDTFFNGILKGFDDLNQFLSLIVNAVTGQAGGLNALAAYFTARWDDLTQVLTTLGLYPTPAQQAKTNADLKTILTAFQNPANNAAWTAAWNALMDLLGWSNAQAFWTKVISTFFPTGATTANPLFVASGASNATDWLTRLVTDLLILLDVFHAIYQAGSSGDSTTQLGTNGKRTWYSAWNDLKVLTGQTTGATIPGDGAPTIGQAITTTQANHQALADAVNQGVVPAAAAGATAPVVNSTVATLQQAVSGLQSQVVNLQSTVNGPTIVLRDSGQDNSVANSMGPNWTATASLVDRNANYGFIWHTPGSTKQLEIGIYNTPLTTNDQVGTIVLNSLMTYWPADFYGGSYYQYGAAENWIINRCDSSLNPKNFLFARIRYNDVQVGYCKAGVITMLGSPTTFKAATASSYTFQAGDASSDYNFKITSGGRVIATYTDSANVTSFCVNNKYTGQAWQTAQDPTGGSTAATPAATSWLAYDAIATAGIPIGFGHVNRLSATTVTTTNGVPPPSFWDNQVAIGSGISLATSGNSGFVVAKAGLYSFSFAINTASQSGTIVSSSAILVNNAIVEKGQPVIYTPYGGVGTITNLACVCSTAGLLLNAGDTVSPQHGLVNMNGDSTGSASFMKIAKIG